MGAPVDELPGEPRREWPHLPDFGDFYDDARARLLPRLRREFGALGEDAFHDMIVAAFERWPEVATLEHSHGWAWVVARRAAVRRSRRDQRRADLEARVAARRPVLDVPEGRAGHELTEALAAMRVEHAQAFRLTQVADLEVEVAADRLGVPANTVKVWVHRARNTLAWTTSGLAGRWQCESATDQGELARSLIARGHATHLDAAMCCLVDRPVRWEIHIDRGRYWLGTDDGERMDTGKVAVCRPGSLSLTSVALSETVEGVTSPMPPGAEGTSLHTFAVDGDRLRLTHVGNDLPPTNGVPDPVFREIFTHEIVYRWSGPTRFAGQFDIVS